MKALVAAYVERRGVGWLPDPELMLMMAPDRLFCMVEGWAG